MQQFPYMNSARGYTPQTAREQSKRELKEMIGAGIWRGVGYAAKGISYVFKGALAIGIVGLTLNLAGVEIKDDRPIIGKRIEEMCQDTSKPLYSEPSANISLWNLDGRGRQGEIDIEAVTTHENPIKVLWYNPDHTEDIRKKGWVMDTQSKPFTPYEKFRADNVANFQALQLASAEIDSK